MAVIRPNAEPPITAVASGDIFLIDGATGVRALAATSVALRDANGNVALNNVVEGFTSTATAGGTTTLTVASASQQFFTGTLAQTVVLPVTSTLQVGQGFFFQNSSTAAVAVESSGGNAVKVIGPGAFAIVTCISLTGTTAASWQASYFGDIVVSGRVLTVSNSLTLAGTDGTAMTFPATSATIARTDAGQTFTGTQAFGALTATSLNGNVLTAGTGVLTIAAAKTLTASNSLTLAGTDGTVMTFPATSATLARTDAANTFTGTQTVGALTATTINGNTVTAGTGVLTIAAAKTLTVSNSLALAGTDGTTQTFPATSGTVVTSASVNAVTNAMRAQMAAYTLKGNATAALANEADIDVTALTLKSAPVSADIVLIQDSAASNAFKRTTVGALSSAGSVASIAGNTGAFTLAKGVTNVGNVIELSLTNATFDASPTNPTGTVSTTGVMMGMGSACQITPVYSGRVKVTFTGSLQNNGPSGGVATAIGRFADNAVTAAPANAASPAGTVFGNPGGILGSGGTTLAVPYAITAIVTGLTVGHLYWFDQELATNVGTNSVDILSPHVRSKSFKHGNIRNHDPRGQSFSCRGRQSGRCS
jgi:hypothetical protein